MNSPEARWLWSVAGAIVARLTTAAMSAARWPPTPLANSQSGTRGSRTRKGGNARQQRPVRTPMSAARRGDALCPARPLDPGQRIEEPGGQDELERAREDPIGGGGGLVEDQEEPCTQPSHPRRKAWGAGGGREPPG